MRYEPTEQTRSTNVPNIQVADLTGLSIDRPMESRDFEPSNLGMTAKATGKGRKNHTSIDSQTIGAETR